MTSANEILSIAIDLIRPNSIVDVGCGLGTWLHIAKIKGIETILGIDGDYINRNELLIPQQLFTPHDLTQVLQIDRKFDLAISMEVAEHLPESCATQFITNLCDTSDVVMFSAAIPNQGGTNHINEQWQSYWADKFAQNNFIAVDCIRPKIWSNNKIAYYYAQNVILYVKKEKIENFPALSIYNKNEIMLSLVHPQKWLELNSLKYISLQKYLSMFPLIFTKSILGIIGKVFPSHIRQNIKAKYFPKLYY